MGPAGIGAEVEGIHAVAAAVAAGRVERLLVEKSRAEELERLVEEARRAGANVELVDDVRSLAATGAPQGVIANCRPIEPVSLEEAAAAVAPAAVVVLDHLEDPRNVGAVARSALAAGVRGMVVARRRAAPLGATAFKAAAGALEQMEIAETASTAAAVAALGKLGLWTVGLDVRGEQPILGLPILADPVAVVIGSEGRGLGRLVSERVDVVAHIPMAGRVESLNASVAAAVALFEVARVRGLFER